MRRAVLWFSLLLLLAAALCAPRLSVAAEWAYTEPGTPLLASPLRGAATVAVSDGRAARVGGRSIVDGVEWTQLDLAPGTAWVSADAAFSADPPLPRQLA